MGSTDRPYPPREPRCAVRDGQVVRAEVLRGEVDGAPVIAAELLDISRGGMKLKVEKPLSFHEQVEIRIEFPDVDVKLSLTAHVCWIRNGTDDDWWTVGCVLPESVSPDILDKAASHGMLDRRQSPRSALSRKAAVRWEAHRDTKEASLLNISERGFCVTSDETELPGKKLQLLLDDEDGTPVGATAKSCWCVEFETGYVIGCELCGDDIHALIGNSNQAHAATRRQLSARSLVSVAALLLIAFLAGLLF